MELVRIEVDEFTLAVLVEHIDATSAGEKDTSAMIDLGPVGLEKIIV